MTLEQEFVCVMLERGVGRSSGDLVLQKSWERVYGARAAVWTLERESVSDARAGVSTLERGDVYISPSFDFLDHFFTFISLSYFSKTPL